MNHYINASKTTFYKENCALVRNCHQNAVSRKSGYSVITVENAYGQLSDEGYIYSMPKRGFYVSDIDMVVARGINMKGISQSADRKYFW